MFVLTLVGWLLFRETELSAIVRDLRLAPWNSSPFERQAGLYLFLLAFGYSIPLWAQSVWVELHRGVPRTADAILVDRCRAAEGARLRRRVHGDPRPAQPHLAGLHLLPVLKISVATDYTDTHGSRPRRWRRAATVSMAAKSA